jgi:hypothetical protein
VNTVQRTLVEAWGLIRETFVDPTFNHQGIWGILFSVTPIDFRLSFSLFLPLLIVFLLPLLLKQVDVILNLSLFIVSSVLNKW